MKPENDNIIELVHLKKYFKTNHGVLHAVDDVNLKIKRGTTCGVVGESGCGKSTLGRTMIHLLDSTDGRIIFRLIEIVNARLKLLLHGSEKIEIAIAQM